MIDVEETFTRLNACNVNYVVLRNFEDLLHPSFLNQHPDIDFLCDDSSKLISAIDAKPKLDFDDGIHYTVQISNKIVPIDVRVVGDNYYDMKWEEEILHSRELYKSFCYVPNTENYYYSLLYHALIQKKTISDDYLTVFKQLEKELQLSGDNMYIEKLERYMEDRFYKYVYPNDIGVGFYISKCNRKLILRDAAKKRTRDLIKFKQMIRRLI